MCVMYRDQKKMVVLHHAFPFDAENAGDILISSPNLLPFSNDVIRG